MTWPVVSEKAEQAAGVALLEALGAAVYVSGTVRRKGDHPGTMQTPGIPDVECFLPPPRRSGGTAWRLVKWEVKRAQGSRSSPAQRAYAARCADAAVAYVVGPASALEGWLRDWGYL